MLRPALTPEALQRWPVWLEAALWLLLAMQAAWLVWRMLAPAPAPAPATLAPLPTPAPALAGHEPFFRQHDDGGNTATATLEGWKLFGLRSGAHASAILGQDKGVQRAYRPGDELAPGLVLDSVAADHVQLRLAGALRRLDLAIATARPGSAPVPAAADAPVPLPQAAPDLPPAGDHIPRLAIPEGSNSLLLRAAGLRPGDVVLSINGQAPDTNHLPRLAEQLKNDPRAVIVFERGGQTHTTRLGGGTP